MKARSTGKKRRAMELLSTSPEETQKIGAEIGRSLPIPGIVLLRGDLGAGKTTLTRGIAQGLGLADTSLVNSPSFTLVNVYQGICPIYHVDLYRLEGARDLYSIGLDDFMGSEGVTIIEWSERLTDKIEDATEVEITDAGDEQRLLRIYAPAKKASRRG